MPDENREHARSLLAIGDVARIERCPECDVVSIHVGPATLRLDSNACASLHATLGQALHALRAPRRGLS